MLKNIVYKLYAKRLLIALLLVLSFHLVGNVVWIALNKSPPSWDEANHIRRSVQYTYFIQDLVAEKPDWGMARDSFQDGYGPLVRIITGIFMLFTGVGVVQTQIVSTLFFLATIVAVYLLSKELAQKQYRGQSTEYIGLIAFGSALVFSSYQLIYAHSRWLLLDIPVTLFTTLSYLFLIKSGWGCKRKETILAGVFAACAMLTKAQAIVYFAIPALYVIWQIVNRNSRESILRQAQDDKHNNVDVHASPASKEIDHSAKAALINAVISFIICLLLFSLWALPNLTHMYEYVKAGATIRLNHPDDLRSVTTWTFYLKLIINNITTLWGLLLWIPACVVFLRTHKKHTLFIVSVVFGYYVWFSFISNKDLRFIYPIFPFIAYIGAFGWARILAHMHNSRKAVWMGIAIVILPIFFVFQIGMYTTLSFRWPFSKSITAYVMVPGIDDITFLNTASEYPVNGYGVEKWPVQELANDLKMYFADKAFTYVFLIPNFEHFNNNTITLGLTRVRAKNIVLMGGINKQRFDNDQDIENFVSQYTHFLYVEGEFGPDFQWDREVYQQIQVSIQKRIANGGLKTVKKYILPNEKTVYWYSTK